MSAKLAGIVAVGALLIASGIARGQEYEDVEEAVLVTFDCWQKCLDDGKGAEISLRAHQVHDISYWAWYYDYYRLWPHALEKAEGALRYARKTKQPRRVVTSCSDAFLSCQKAYDYYFV